MQIVIDTINIILSSSVSVVVLGVLICLYTTWRFGRKNQYDIYQEFDKLIIFILVWVFFSRLIYFITFFDKEVEWSLLPFRNIIDFDTNSITRVYLDTYPWAIFRVWDFRYFISASLLIILLYSMIESKFTLGKTYFNSIVRRGRVSIILICIALVLLYKNNFSTLNTIEVFTYPWILGGLVVGYLVSLTRQFSNATFMKAVHIFSLVAFALSSLLAQQSIKKIVVYIGVLLFIVSLLLIEKVRTINENVLNRSKSDFDILKERARVVRKNRGEIGLKNFNQSYREVNESTIELIFGKEGIKGYVSKLLNRKNENSSK